jgi:hypothetical protein
MTLSFFLGLELEDGELVVPNASAFQNNHWKAEEDDKMILQRGARGIYR